MNNTKRKEFHMNKTYLPNEIAVIDVESSGLDLSVSYPIEIAWLSLSDEFDEFLINPNTASNWDYWSDDSALIHNISRSQCVSDGLHVIEAANRLNSLLNGCLVISDAVGFDMTWIDRLFAEAGTNRDFDIIDISQFIHGIGAPPELISKFYKVKRESKTEHRALSDCRGIIKICRAIGLLR